jgi:hypothetical protein
MLKYLGILGLSPLIVPELFFPQIPHLNFLSNRAQWLEDSNREGAFNLPTIDTMCSFPPRPKSTEKHLLLEISQK